MCHDSFDRSVPHKYCRFGHAWATHNSDLRRRRRITSKTRSLHRRRRCLYHAQGQARCRRSTVPCVSVSGSGRGPCADIRVRTRHSPRRTMLPHSPPRNRHEIRSSRLSQLGLTVPVLGGLVTNGKMRLVVGVPAALRHNWSNYVRDVPSCSVYLLIAFYSRALTIVPVTTVRIS